MLLCMKVENVIMPFTVLFVKVDFNCRFFCMESITLNIVFTGLQVDRSSLNVYK